MEAKPKSKMTGTFKALISAALRPVQDLEVDTTNATSSEIAGAVVVGATLIALIALLELYIFAPVILLVAYALLAIQNRWLRTRVDSHVSQRRMAAQTTLRNAALGGLVTWCLMVTINPLFYGGIPILDWFYGIKALALGVEQENLDDLIIFSVLPAYLITYLMVFSNKVKALLGTDIRPATDDDSSTGTITPSTNGGFSSGPQTRSAKEFGDSFQPDPEESPDESIQAPTTRALENFAAMISKKTPRE